MKHIVSAVVVLACILATGCVRRTVTVEPTFANPATQERYSSEHSKLVEEKIVWFWQKEFRNP